MEEGKVSIHGKTYLTVAYRINEFRKEYPLRDGWGIQTTVLNIDAEGVLVKASVISPGGMTIGTGHGYENYQGKINSTSAVENAETSAIGRALAACGLGGTEYASANEVQTAISHQKAGHSNRPQPVAGSVHEVPVPVIPTTVAPQAAATTPEVEPAVIPATASTWDETGWAGFVSTIDDGDLLLATFRQVAADEAITSETAAYTTVCKVFSNHGRKVIDKRTKTWRAFVEQLNAAHAKLSAVAA